MQTRDQAAQAQRKPPEGMPTRVPPRRPPRAAPRTGEPLPAQKPVTDEPEIRPPAQWKMVVKRMFAILGLVISLALVYVFLLIGEPDEDEQLTQQVQKQEETIRVPIAAAQVAGTADLNALAVNFGMPVLTLQGETLQKATLFDTAFRGGYSSITRMHPARPSSRRASARRRRSLCWPKEALRWRSISFTPLPAWMPCVSKARIPPWCLPAARMPPMPLSYPRGRRQC